VLVEHHDDYIGEKYIPVFTLAGRVVGVVEVVGATLELVSVFSLLGVVVLAIEAVEVTLEVI
jgi:hypothetical protein